MRRKNTSRTTPRLRQAMMKGEPIDFAAPMLCPKLYPKGSCQGEIVSLSKESNMKALRQVRALRVLGVRCVCGCVNVCARVRVCVSLSLSLFLRLVETLSEESSSRLCPVP